MARHIVIDLSDWWLMFRADPRAVALQALTSVHGVGAVMAKELVDEKGINR